MRYLAFVACLFLLNCDDVDRTQKQTQNIHIINTTGPTGVAPIIGEEEEPQLVTAVVVSAFGLESGPQDAIPGASVRVGNSQPITCTPKRADGTDASPEEHGPAPSYFGPVAGSAFARAEATSNPFNLDIVGQAGGIYVVQCIVGGHSGQLSMLVVP